MAQLFWYFDQTRCTGCLECGIACKDWHDIPPGPVAWRRSFEFERGSFPRVEALHVSISCLHCTDAPCIAACPTRAISKREKDGVVLVDRDRCDGNRACLDACPYGVPQFDPEPPAGAPPGSRPRMSMCNFCVDRLDQGLNPACVDACTMRAMDWGTREQLLAKYPDARVPDREGAVPGFPDPARDHLGRPSRWGTARPSLVVRPRQLRADLSGPFTIRHGGTIVERM